VIDRPNPAGLDPATTARPAASGLALERSIARLLTLGTYCAIALLAVGVVLLLASGLGPRSPEPRFDPAAIPGDIAAFTPAGFIWLGLVVMIATPSARVAAALVGYVRRDERDMAIVAVLVLIVIATSVLVARAVEG
jgi:uncharacterized membrane protein